MHSKEQIRTIMRKIALTTEIWPYLPVAQALFETGSVSLAADHLHVNRTTIDRRLKSLEASLGGSVFERHDGRFTPTPMGREVLRAFEAARAAFAFLDSADARAGTGGPLRLTFPPHCASLLAPAFLRLAQPVLGYDIDLSPSYAMSNLQNREADIAIRLLRSTPEPPLTGMRLSWLSGGLYRSRAVPDPAALVLRPWETALPDYASDIAGSLPLVRATDIQTMLELIASGGIGRLPHFFASQDTRLERVKDLPSEDWQIWILTHLNFARSPRIQHAMEVISETLLSAPAIADDPDPRNHAPTN